MPPRVIKQKTTTSQQTLRHNGHRESRKQVVIEEEEQDDADLESGSEVDYTEEEDVEDLNSTQTTTQSTRAGRHTDATDVILGMIGGERKRNEFAKSKIMAAYRKEVSETKESITTLFDAHEAESSQSHEAQLNRLRKLLEQKAKIEEEMQERVARLRNDYAAHAMDLQRIVANRARQLK